MSARLFKSTLQSGPELAYAASCRWASAALLATMLACFYLPSPFRFTPSSPVMAEDASSISLPATLFSPIPSTPQNPAILSNADADLYRIIFSAQENGDNAAADTAITQLSNGRLVGVALAERYLAPHAAPTTAALKDWLAQYADHPQAVRIAHLAIRRGLDVALATDDAPPLKGDGYTDHMGRNTMPDSWYHGLGLWREQDYSAAEPVFAQIGEDASLSDWQRAAGYYWAYRSATRADDTIAAHDNLHNAAHYPTTFYGLLAMRAAGLPALEATAPEVKSAVRDDPRTIRAALLAQLGRSDEAEDELRHLYSSLSERERPGIVTLAGEMGLANLQVRLAHMPGLTEAQSLYANYPAPKQITDAQHVMDPALLLAIARNESSFRDDVKSGGGAVGMMQMLPSTARAVERRVGRDALEMASAGDNDASPLAERLSNPALSIRYGAQYLKLLTQEPAIGHNLVRLLAGYNAGPGTVASWQSAAGHIEDPLLYIESIPYPETHNYVMQVMAQYWIYQQRLGEPSTTMVAVANGKWPVI